MSTNIFETLSRWGTEHILLADLNRFDPRTGELKGGQLTKRHLSDVKSSFADRAGVTSRLAEDDPLIYTVAALSPRDGEGDLHVGLGRIMPGRIGNEFYLTKGHLHTWRAAAEIYIGLMGEGVMLLEDEGGRESRAVPLLPNTVVYVPGHTAHRTINTGSDPLSYLGVYPARAGHDYGFIAERNFRHVVVAGKGGPQILERSAFLASLGDKR